MKPIRNIIFDLDGTLVDSSDGVVDAVNYSLRKLGQAEQPAHRIKPFIGFPLSTMYPVFTDAPLAELYAHFQVRAQETVVSSAVALDGADDVIRELARRFDVRLAIVSTKIRPHIDGIVARLGWTGLFSAIVGGNEVTSVKPDPEAMHLALGRLGGAAIDTLVIGDTINDVLAAKAVPLEVLGVVSPYGDDAELRRSLPDKVFGSISELLVEIAPRLRAKSIAS